MAKDIITKLTSKIWLVLTIIVLIHIFLLLQINFFPYPELFVYPYLTAKGLIPYTQIFDQHFPGLMFLKVNLYTLGFDTPFDMRFLQIGIIGLEHILIYLVSQKIFKKRKLSLIPNLLFLFWHPFYEGYVLWIDSFLPIFLLLSSYFLISIKKTKINKYLFLTGFFLGIALVFKQVIGPAIVVIGLYVLWRYRSVSKATFFSIGVLIPIGIVLYSIYASGSWSDFYYWTVTFNLTTFAEMGRKYATFGEIIKFSLIGGVALLSIIKILENKNSDKILPVYLFFLFSLLFVYARFDFVHLQPALPFTLLLVTYLFINIKLSNTLKTLVIIFHSLVSMVIVANFYQRMVGDKVYFYGSREIEVFEEVKSKTDLNDPVLALATLPNLYPFTNTLPSGKLFVFHFPWFMKEAEDKILEGVIKDPPVLVVRESQSYTDGMLLLDYMPKLNLFVESNYVLDKKIGSYEILVKK